MNVLRTFILQVVVPFVQRHFCEIKDLSFVLETLERHEEGKYFFSSRVTYFFLELQPLLVVRFAGKRNKYISLVKGQCRVYAASIELYENGLITCVFFQIFSNTKSHVDNLQSHPLVKSVTHQRKVTRFLKNVNPNRADASENWFPRQELSVNSLRSLSSLTVKLIWCPFCKR